MISMTDYRRIFAWTVRLGCSAVLRTETSFGKMATKSLHVRSIEAADVQFYRQRHRSL